MVLSTIIHCYSSSVVRAVKMSGQFMATIDLKSLLGTAIKTQRASLGISQEELAHRAGLHRTYVSDLERGARNPSVDSIEKLAGALQLSVSSLFEKASDADGLKDSVEILVVEDNPRDVDLTKRAFKEANITNPLHVVRDGVEAIDFIFASGPYVHRREARLPGLILLDLDLPKKSGLDVLQEVKANPRTQNIPVIILTISNRDRVIAACRRLGAKHYIVKPVGFQNFSALAVELSLGWTLVKPSRADGSSPAERKIDTS
ncbi:MAG TPA: response regulator [Chthoniobacterales bacterium]|nr:response regulator [Chthoniobacterales bacterium]